MCQKKDRVNKKKIIFAVILRLCEVGNDEWEKKIK